MGRRIGRSVGSGKLDLVLVVDVSESMSDEIRYIAGHLGWMLKGIAERGIDLRVIVVRFRHGRIYALLRREIVISKPMVDPSEVIKLLRSIKCRGDERALDALWRAAEEIEFRPGADRWFVFVTDEAVSGERRPYEVLDLIRRKGIRVYVIGLNEPFQKALARLTGGEWRPIWKVVNYE